MGERVKYLDLAKGIGILLMLYQHSIPQHNLFRQELQAFVMPLFFVICGFLVWLKYGAGMSKAGTPLSENLKKRVRQLGVPYFLTGIVMIAFYAGLGLLSGSETNLSRNLIRIITLQGIDSLWFLPVYFFAEGLFLVLFSYFKRPSFYLILIGILFLLCIMVRFDGVPWPYALVVKTIMGVLFIAGGYIIASRELLGWMDWRSAMVLILLCLIGGYSNGFASFACFNNPILYLIDGLGLSVVLIYLCSKCDAISGFINEKFLFIGSHTLAILCINNLVLEILRLIDYHLTNNLLLRTGMIGNTVFFILLTLTCYYCIIFMMTFKKKYK